MFEFDKYGEDDQSFAPVVITDRTADGFGYMVEIRVGSSTEVQASSAKLRASGNHSGGYGWESLVIASLYEAKLDPLVLADWDSEDATLLAWTKTATDAATIAEHARSILVEPQRFETALEAARAAGVMR